jgi:hypothetical protein
MEVADEDVFAFEKHLEELGYKDGVFASIFDFL